MDSVILLGLGGSNLMTVESAVTTERKNDKAPISALREYLNTITRGTIDKTEVLERLLADAWCDLDGGSDGGMQPYKIWGRLETVEWDSASTEVL